MGLQNAMVTKISQSEVRANRDRLRLRLHAMLLACFAGGGLAGALAFQWLSFYATLPIALLLAGLAAVPIIDDLQAA